MEMNELWRKEKETEREGDKDKRSKQERSKIFEVLRKRKDDGGKSMGGHWDWNAEAHVLCHALSFSLSIC